MRILLDWMLRSRKLQQAQIYVDLLFLHLGGAVFIAEKRWWPQEVTTKLNVIRPWIYFQSLCCPNCLPQIRRIKKKLLFFLDASRAILSLQWLRSWLYINSLYAFGYQTGPETNHDMYFTLTGGSDRIENCLFVL